jgi:hypothetical protein
MNLMLRLAKARKICPPSLLIQTNARLEAFDWAWRAGGYADVHRGTYDNGQIVLKKVRVSGDEEKRKPILVVSVNDLRSTS